MSKKSKEINKERISSIAEELLKQDKKRKEKAQKILKEEKRLKELERIEIIHKDGSAMVTFLRNSCLKEDASDQDIIEFMSGISPENRRITRTIYTELNCCEDGWLSDEYKDYASALEEKGIFISRMISSGEYNPSMHQIGGYYGTTFSFSIGV